MASLADLCFLTDRKFKKFFRWLKVHRFSHDKSKKMFGKSYLHMCAKHLKLLFGNLNVLSARITINSVYFPFVEKNLKNGHKVLPLRPNQQGIFYFFVTFMRRPYILGIEPGILYPLRTASHVSR